jgi:hypothetical protein
VVGIEKPSVLETTKKFKNFFKKLLTVPKVKPILIKRDKFGTASLARANVAPLIFEN